MKSHQLLRCIFPDVLADYFDVVDIQESVSQFDFWLDERNFMEKSDHKLGTVSSYGFTSERVIQDFPLRGKAVYLMFAVANDLQLGFRTDPSLVGFRQRYDGNGYRKQKSCNQMITTLLWVVMDSNHRS